MTFKENITCSNCDNFTYKSRQLNGRTTEERVGHCTYYDRQESPAKVYGLCEGASPIPIVIEKPKLVKKEAPKRTTKSLRK